MGLSPSFVARTCTPFGHDHSLPKSGSNNPPLPLPQTPYVTPPIIISVGLASGAPHIGPAFLSASVTISYLMTAATAGAA